TATRLPCNIADIVPFRNLRTGIRAHAQIFQPAVADPTAAIPAYLLHLDFILRPEFRSPMGRDARAIRLDPREPEERHHDGGFGFFRRRDELQPWRRELPFDLVGNDAAGPALPDLRPAKSASVSWPDHADPLLHGGPHPGPRHLCRALKLVHRVGVLPLFAF